MTPNKWQKDSTLTPHRENLWQQTCSSIGISSTSEEGVREDRMLKLSLTALLSLFLLQGALASDVGLDDGEDEEWVA
jgi:hypothetical protein